ncbi:MAG: hypothetical protein K9J17_03235 [Flavobacteriales bacterium]|nr:hypothetical protein [Flavobacteriales bacterium]
MAKNKDHPTATVVRSTVGTNGSSVMAEGTTATAEGTTVTVEGTTVFAEGTTAKAACTTVLNGHSNAAAEGSTASLASLF